MTNERDDLKGLATWDAHRSCWVPEHGKQGEVASVLGGGWAFDDYYSAFFANAPEAKPSDAEVFPEGACCGTPAVIVKRGEFWDVVPAEPARSFRPPLQDRVEAAGVSWELYCKLSGEEVLRDDARRMTKEEWHEHLLEVCKTYPGSPREYVTEAHIWLRERCRMVIECSIGMRPIEECLCALEEAIAEVRRRGR